MEWGVFFGLVFLIVAFFRPLRACISASDSEGVQRFRRLHKPMEWIGATALVISALDVLFWREAIVHAAIPVLGGIVFYCSMLTRPNPGTAARSRWMKSGPKT